METSLSSPAEALNNALTTSVPHEWCPLLYGFLDKFVHTLIYS